MRLSETASTATGGILAIVLIIFLLVLGPWLLFWSVGVLSTAAGYPFMIPLTFKTWLAAVVLIAILSKSSK